MIIRKRNGSVFIIRLTLVCGYLCHLTLASEAPEFQYPCYVDVCTFPRQFCNSDKYERRCSPCSVSLCRQERVPLACKYQCNRLLNPTKATLAPVTNNDPSNDNTETETSSIYLIAAYNAIVITLFVIALMISVACYVQKKRTKGDRTGMHIRQDSYRSYQGQNGEAVPLQPCLAADRISRLPEVVCPNCRVIRENDCTPPPYRTMATPNDTDVPDEPNNSETHSSLVAQDTGNVGGAATPCRSEMTEMETQTTPKEPDYLSFDFNTTSLKSKDL